VEKTVDRLPDLLREIARFPLANRLTILVNGLTLYLCERNTGQSEPQKCARASIRHRALRKAFHNLALQKIKYLKV
jgi:hypothetical protein